MLLPAVSRFSGLGRRLSPRGQTDRIRRRLDLAGNPEKWDVDRVYAFKVLGLIGGGLIGILLSVALGASVLLAVGLILILSITGLLAPNLALLQASQTRQQQIQKDLPDALDLLSISVEAGLGFDAALAQVARNTTGPLAEEFFRVLQEMQIGTGRTGAMRALGDRTAMVQADAFGVPIANVLRVQAGEMRVKRSQRAEEQAQKVPVKILFPLIFCILPALFIVVIGPAGISIIRNIAQR